MTYDNNDAMPKKSKTEKQVRPHGLHVRTKAIQSQLDVMLRQQPDSTVPYTRREDLVTTNSLQLSKYTF